MPVMLWTDTTTRKTIGLAGTDLDGNWFGTHAAPDGYGMIAKSFEHKADAVAYAQGFEPENAPVDRPIAGSTDYSRPQPEHVRVRLHHTISSTRGECLCGQKVYRSHGLGDWIHEGSHSIWCDTRTVAAATAAR